MGSVSCGTTTTLIRSNGALLRSSWGESTQPSCSQYIKTAAGCSLVARHKRDLAKFQNLKQRYLEINNRDRNPRRPLGTPRVVAMAMTSSSSCLRSVLWDMPLFLTSTLPMPTAIAQEFVPSIFVGILGAQNDGTSKLSDKRIQSLRAFSGTTFLPTIYLVLLETCCVLK